MLVGEAQTDMRFVKNFTTMDFQAKNFTPLFSPNFNSFGDKNTENEYNGEIYITVTLVTNLTFGLKPAPRPFANCSMDQFDERIVNHQQKSKSKLMMVELSWENTEIQ